MTTPIAERLLDELDSIRASFCDNGLRREACTIADAIAALSRQTPLRDALAEVFADHGKVNSLAWTDKAAAALCAQATDTSTEGDK